MLTLPDINIALNRTKTVNEDRCSVISLKSNIKLVPSTDGSYYSMIPGVL